MNDDKKAPDFYVAIGASAGGLEAIESFFTNMPPKNNFGFIVIQHLSPDYKSLMVEILSKKTDMPVHRVEDGMEVEPGNVYLIPPKKNMSIFHGKLILSDQDYSRGINLPIDVFFRALAEDQAEKTIAIILSGTGSDGMRGIRSVKQFGGMIMVQNEESAKFDGMPRAAVSTGLADFILPPEEMPDQIIAFTKHPHSAGIAGNERILKDEDGLTKVFSMLRERFKVDFTYYKPSTVTRRIERRMTINQIETIDDYVNVLKETPSEITILFRELLIGVTSFFRDQEVYSALETEYIPELLQDTDNRDIRFWVAGCSTGEEAYSLAIVVRECLERLKISRDIKIFATDIDSDAIHFAAVGSYPESIAADVPLHYLNKYFYKREDHFQISRTVREMVVFAQHNLIKDPPFTNIDLISCRNLLIYLQPVLQGKVFDYFNFSLRAKGLMVLGTSESTGDRAELFKALNSKLKIYRALGLSRDRHETGISPRITDTRFREQRGHYAGIRKSLQSDNDSALERFLEAASGEYFPLTALVSEDMEIIHLIGNSTGIFKIPAGRPSFQIDKIAVKELSIPLSTGVQKVFRQGKELHFTNIRVKQDGNTRIVNLHILPLPGKKQHQPLVAVLIKEEKPAEEAKETVTAQYDLSAEAEQRIRDLEQELQFTRENLQATIEELETSNEELQATNEELLASNEELQSTNEELQSTNEELYTVNTEYQNKIIELTELNNDVDNLLSASMIGKLIVDENLEVRRFSPKAADVFRVLDNDIGRPITHISNYLVDFDPVPAMQQVQETSEPAEWEVQTETGSWYLMRILPYTVSPDNFSGLVLSFVDITNLKQSENRLRENQELLSVIQKLNGIGGWEYDVEQDRMIWTDEAYELHGIDKSSLEPGSPEHIEKSLRCYHDEDRKAVQEAFQRCVNEGIPYELEVRFKSLTGRTLWVRTAAQPVMEAGRVKRVTGTFVDITKRKNTENRMSILFEHTQAAIFVEDCGRVISNCNRSFSNLLGYERADILGKSSMSFIKGNKEYKRRNKDIENPGTTPDGTYTLTYKQVNGGAYTGTTHVYFLRDADGQCVGSISIILTNAEEQKDE